MFSTCPSVRLSVSPSVRPITNLWTRYFEYEWTDFAANCHRRSTRQWGWNGQLWGSKGQSETVNFGGQKVKVKRSALRVKRSRWNGQLWGSKGQGDTTPKLALETRRRHRSRSLRSSGFSSATSNDMKSVRWPLMGGLLHSVQRGGHWAGPQPAQAFPRSTKRNSPPINVQCTNHRIAV